MSARGVLVVALVAAGCGASSWEGAYDGTVAIDVTCDDGSAASERAAGTYEIRDVDGRLVLDAGECAVPLDVEGNAVTVLPTSCASGLYVWGGAGWRADDGSVFITAHATVGGCDAVVRWELL